MREQVPLHGVNSSMSEAADLRLGKPIKNSNVKGPTVITLSGNRVQEINQQMFKIKRQALQEFADWSGDRNPIHVDPVAAKASAFGGNIVHGALTAITLLNRESLLQPSESIESLEIEFRGEVRPECEYQTTFKAEADTVSIQIGDDAHPRMLLEVGTRRQQNEFLLKNTVDWIQHAHASGNLTSTADSPREWTPRNLVANQTECGIHQFGEVNDSAFSTITGAQAKALGLCSFIVGMRAPGLSSLFTRLKISFSNSSTTENHFAYCLTFLNYDPHFRLLETRLEIATPEGKPVAIAELQSYVRFPQSDPQPEGFAEILRASKCDLEGQVALVCGASRGLGAELAAALGAAKCHVYLAARTITATSERLMQDIVAQGGTAVFLVGDVGSKQWCDDAREQILAKHGCLDLLILNACAPVLLTKVGDFDPNANDDYLSSNIALSMSPLNAFMPTLAKCQGTVVAISSSAVTELPSGFGEYVAVKMAVEGAVQTAAKENPNTQFFIIRPPKLQTSWNDTPSRAIGSISPAAAAAKILLSTAQKQDDGNLQLVDHFEESDLPTLHQGRKANVGICLCGTFTLDPFGPSISRWSDELGLNIEVSTTPYAQVLQQTLDPTSELSGSEIGSSILIRVSDWLRELSEDRLSDMETVENWITNAATEYIEALKTHRSFASGSTYVLICPSSEHKSVRTSFVQQIEQRLHQELNGVPGLVVDIAKNHHLDFKVPDAEIHDALREDIAHIPFTNTYYHFLSALITRFLHSKIRTPKKVVCVDCDNTLWDGVVGEVGAKGLYFKDAHLALQRKLNRLAMCGTLICLVSKNEEHDVWSVFEQRDDFELRRECVVAVKANWQPKSQSLIELADTLNLGLDSFVFLDDNPVECAEVRSGCPDALTIQWPQDTQAATSLLSQIWELDESHSTVEDKKRTQMYREEFKREESLQTSTNFEEFLESLDLVFDSRPLSEEDFARASQLTMRTNQFNFTTIRRNESELQVLSADPDYFCRTIRVSDRFGDYGLVGFLIAKLDEGAVGVDTFLLSCRVLGRGVEHQMASELARIATEHDREVVRWQHIPTDRNTPARLFLQGLLGKSDPKVDSAELLDVKINAEELLSARFEPASIKPTTPQRKSTKEGDRSSEKTEPPAARQRENQITQIAHRLSSYELLEKTFGTAEATLAEVTDDQIAEVVISAFSSSLRKPETEIVQTDRLDLLGCDSLRIVEITVALTKHFPWLPKTLLFEHRSVSEIIAGIEETAGQKTTDHSLARVQTDGLEVSSETEDIAIVGMDIHCAGAKSLTEFWNLLIQGKSAIRRVPEARATFVGSLNDRREHFVGLIDDAANFDADFFNISRREAEYLDPQLRLLLQNAWRATEDAGESLAESQSKVGVFAGVMYSEYGKFANAVGARTDSLYRCWEGFSVANRISQALGCRGPSVSIDTACSSSATALHYACQSLLRRDCNAAIVCGANLIIDPSRLSQFGRLGILSPSGKCVPFGREADGTVLGEGVVSVVLRPLQDAVERGDRIYAVIKGTGVSSGAGTTGFTAPNPKTQSDAAAAAIQNSNIDPRTISYIETHGTGTELGDPIEIRGLQMAYCNQDLWDLSLEVDATCSLGSIKPNIGHLEAGSGLMGVAKASLQLYHAELTPSITSRDANEQIPFDELPFTIQRTLSRWQRKSAKRQGKSDEVPRRAAVNSFGIGGSNVHVVLEESPPSIEDTANDSERTSHVLALSANSNAGIGRQANAWNQFLNETDLPFADCSFSANIGRKHHRCRAAVVASSREQAFDQLQSLATNFSNVDIDERPPTQRKTAFLFTGQGAQYPGMFRDLYSGSPVFRNAFDRCALHLKNRISVPLADVLFDGNSSDAKHRLHRTEYTQPAIFVTQYALYQLWESWGVKSDFMMGHSVGEIAAYCLSGGCSLNDALDLVSARGRLMQSLPEGGTMCSVSVPVETVEESLNRWPGISVAAVNGPNQTVISGSIESISSFSSELEKDGVDTKMLSVSHAFHSSLMEPMLDEFADILASLDLGNPSSPIVSSATGELIHEEMSSIQYWLDQARKPVQFLDAMSSLEGQEITHFIEIGPHPVLLGMGHNCVSSECRWLPSVRRGTNDWNTALSSLGVLYEDGFEINWAAYDAPYNRRRVNVPSYQFEPKWTWLDDLQSEAPSSGEQNENGSKSGKGLTYRVQWKNQRCEATDTSLRPHNCLLLSQSGSVEPETLEAFRVHGSVVQVEKWPTDEKSAADVGKYLAEGKISRIVFLDRARTTFSADALQAEHEIRLSSLIRIVNAAAGHPVDDRSVWILTQETAVTSVKTSLTLQSTGLWGFSRVAALEHPSFWGGMIDCQDWGGQLHEAVREITNPGNDDQILFRNGHRLVPRLNQLSVGHEDIDQVINRIGWNEGAVLITGGLGGIGLSIARWLVDHGAQHLVLTSRSPEPRDSALAVIHELSQQGAKVEFVSADISTKEGVERCVRSSTTPFSGVFHAAGIDLQKPIGKVTAEDLEDVLSPKIRGGWMLHEAFHDSGIKFFVNFSSIAAIFGSADRSVYAAANAFLDAIAQERANSEIPCLSVNLGPVRGLGMADEDAIKELGKIGNRGLEPEVIFELVARLIDQGVSNAAIADIDWDRFRPVFEARRPCPLLAEAQNDVSFDNMSRRSARTTGSFPWVTELASIPSHDRQARLEKLLGGAVAKLLKVESSANITSSTNLFDYGLDSLTSAELSTAIRAGTGILDPSLLLQAPTVAGIAEELCRQLEEERTDPEDPGNLEKTDSFRNRLDQSIANRRELIFMSLLEDLSTTLGRSISEVDTHRSFSEMGVDSLNSTEFSNRIRKRLALDTNPRVLDHQNLEDLATHLADNLPQPVVSDLTGYSEELKPRIIEFCKQAWPNRSRELIEPRWDWMFIGSAKRVNMDPRVWLCTDNERVVGHMGAQFTRLKIGDRELTTAWLVDTMVAESHRPKGVGTRLLMQSKEDMPFSLSLGQTEQIRAILGNLGWHRVGTLQTYLLPLSPSRILKNKIPNAVRPIAAGFLRLRSKARQLQRIPKSRNIELTEIDQFTSQHDELWSSVSADYGCSTVRDASYLNWKYVDQPGQEFTRINIKQNRQLIATVVLKREEPDLAYPYSRCYIVDLVVSKNQRKLREVVGALVGYCRNRKDDAMIMHLINGPIQQALEDWGFIQRPPTRYLVISLPDSAESSSLLSESEWLVTQGDSDIDRPM